MNEWRGASGAWCLTGVVLAMLSMLIGLAVYLSVRGSPSVSEVAWIPEPVGRWADRHDTMRTGVPFFLIAVLAALSALRFRPAHRWLVWVLFATMALLVAGLELYQWYLPHRNPDMADVYWGWAGIVLGCLGAHAIRAMAFLGSPRGTWTR